MQDANIITAIGCSTLVILAALLRVHAVQLDTRRKVRMLWSDYCSRHHLDGDGVPLPESRLNRTHGRGTIV